MVVPQQETALTNRAFDTGTKVFTFKSFLSANATRATNSRHGIDHCSTTNSTTCALQSISMPIMIAAMGAYQLIRDDQIIFEKSGSRDKDYVVIEGALHGFGPYRLREREGRVFQHGEEPVRLRTRLDKQKVLAGSVRLDPEQTARKICVHAKGPARAANKHTVLKSPSGPGRRSASCNRVIFVRLRPIGP